jgi:hypothetical protein
MLTDFSGEWAADEARKCALLAETALSSFAPEEE